MYKARSKKNLNKPPDPDGLFVSILPLITIPLPHL